MYQSLLIQSIKTKYSITRTTATPPIIPPISHQFRLVVSGAGSGDDGTAGGGVNDVAAWDGGGDGAVPGSAEATGLFGSTAGGFAGSFTGLGATATGGFWVAVVKLRV